jgi:hypothetical protein
MENMMGNDILSKRGPTGCIAILFCGRSIIIGSIKTYLLEYTAHKKTTGGVNHNRTYVVTLGIRQGNTARCSLYLTILGDFVQAGASDLKLDRRISPLSMGKYGIYLGKYATEGDSYMAYLDKYGVKGGKYAALGGIYGLGGANADCRGAVIRHIRATIRPAVFGEFVCIAGNNSKCYSSDKIQRKQEVFYA